MKAPPTCGIDMGRPAQGKAHLECAARRRASLRQSSTGERLITYSDYLHGIDETVASRVKDLLAAMDLTDAAGRAVAGLAMTKKVALTAAAPLRALRADSGQALPGGRPGFCR